MKSVLDNSFGQSLYELFFDFSTEGDVRHLPIWKRSVRAVIF